MYRMSSAVESITKLLTRRHRRLKIRGLDTPYGVILDVSESGACLFRKGRTELEPDQIIHLQVRHGGIDLNLPARVVRCQAVGLHRVEVGVEFLEMDESRRAGLHRLMATADPQYSPRVWVAA
jgi:hypothetical protein